jgi:putative ABC transport system ATP-binding protein
MSEPFIICRRIVKAYRVGQHEIVALRGVDFDMERGEMVAIIGPSGAGKSSLLNLLSGLDTPTAGQLIVDGQNLQELKAGEIADYRLKQVGFLWQQIERNLLPHRSALRNITLPMMLANAPMWKRRQMAMELIDAVGLREHAYKYPEQLSGGQQQRVAIAVSLANHPPLLLADEPTGALDRENAEQVLELLHDLRNKFGLTILMVTHDLEIAAHADRVLTLRDGALGQDITDTNDTALAFDDKGRIRLPDEVRSQLTEAANIAVEIRPEGVLLRPEEDEVDNMSALLQDMLPQDAPPETKRRRLWPFRRNNNRQNSPGKDKGKAS